MNQREHLFVVIWDCLTPRAVAVFNNKDDAERFGADFKTQIDALFARIGLTCDERVYVCDAPVNPETMAELSVTVS